MKDMECKRYVVNNTVCIDIDHDTDEIVIVGNGQEVFRKPKTDNNFLLAHQICMLLRFTEVN